MSGDLTSGAEWFRKAIEQRHSLLMTFAVWIPQAAPLRASPHWPALAKMMNLPSAASY
jgi:hypothetical protein